jgi:hypothetical protein
LWKTGRIPARPDMPRTGALKPPHPRKIKSRHPIDPKRFNGISEIGGWLCEADTRSPRWRKTGCRSRMVPVEPNPRASKHSPRGAPGGRIGSVCGARPQPRRQLRVEPPSATAIVWHHCGLRRIAGAACGILRFGSNDDRCGQVLTAQAGRAAVQFPYLLFSGSNGLK